jgi:hypothetical protein
MQNPDWTRLWIMQETILGSSGFVTQCEDASLNEMTFATRVEVFGPYTTIYRRQRTCSRHMIDVFVPWWVEPQGRPTLCTPLAKILWVLSHHQRKGGGHLSFGSLQDVAKSSFAGDVRDKIYGLVGMMDTRPVDRIDVALGTSPSTRKHYYFLSIQTSYKGSLSI